MMTGKCMNELNEVAEVRSLIDQYLKDCRNPAILDRFMSACSGDVSRLEKIIDSMEDAGMLDMVSIGMVYSALSKVNNLELDQ
jgi:hypothetical protein